MVNHRLPSNFYNEVDGDCIKILGGVISICGKCGKTTRAEWRKRECNPIHYSSLRSRHQVPTVPRTKIHLCPNQFIQGTCHSDTALDWFQMEPFMYKDTLQTQVLESAAASVKFGANLTDRKLTDFQEEQMGQLYELMLESTKPNRQFDIQEDGK
uniref:Uncharacterized protein n=1 Tax=Cynoglossus semilaevis TaxID=244447 RepID=A0A3P8V698_CYNSE